MKIVPYSPSLAEDWNSFVSKSKNGTFLFDRRYMDYHSDRFIDSSLMFYENDTLVGLFPASIYGDFVTSHEGLTYGGIILPPNISLLDVHSMFLLLVEWASKEKIREILYKTIPHIYHSSPSEEDLYYLHVGGEVVRRDVLTVVSLLTPPSLSYRRNRCVRKAIDSKLIVRESENFEGFWEILSNNLTSRYNRLPVHCVREIMLLRRRFPENIRLYVTVDRSNRILAGVVLYITKNVYHVQYNASTDEGRKCGALDLLFYELLSMLTKSKPWFDFGISNDYDKTFQIKWLNDGLLTYKEGFGGSTIVHDHYKIHI